MFQHTLIAAAVLVAVCAQAVAADKELGTPDEDTGPTALSALAPVTNQGATLIASAPTKAETTARTFQAGFTQVNKPFANQLTSGNGIGVTVGIVDSGTQIDHPELKGQIIATYNAMTGTTDVTDYMGHGTHVSGLIVGSMVNGAPIEGIAPGAKLVVAKAFSAGSSNTVVIARGIDWVVNVQKTPILSLSLGAAAIALETPIRNAVSKGTLITAALGNDGSVASANWPAEFAKQSWANGQIITVGAIDASNKRASFSSYDPTLANWTVYAPGVDVVSSYSNSTSSTKNAYAYMSGTSMATPIVAGQAALIKSNWNFLSASDIAQVIFQSATHLCADTVTAAVCAARTTADAQYGWGLINIGASLQPIGSLNLGSKSGTIVNFSGSALANPKSGVMAGLSGVTTIALDKFNRGFTVNLPVTYVASLSKSTVGVPSTPTTVVSGGGKFTAEYTTQATVQDLSGMFGAGQGALTLAKTSYSFTSDKGTSYGFGMGGTENQFLGLDATGNTPLNLGGEGSRFNTPYFGLAENASHAAYGVTFDGGTVLRIGAVVQSAQVASALLGSGAAAGSKTLTSVEFQKSFDGATAIVAVGQMQESNSLLGLTGVGALAIGGSARTNFVTLSGSLPLSAKAVLSAMASTGRTGGYDNQSASLIDGTTAVSSVAWSLGLAQKDVFHNGDRFGLTLAMPLRAMSGSMNVTTATSQSQVDGSLQYTTQSISLAPTGHELKLELAYSTPMPFGAQVSTVAQLTNEPGHDASATTQYAVGVKYLKAF